MYVSLHDSDVNDHHLLKIQQIFIINIFATPLTEFK
jgi:hypothetical protein